MSTENFIDASFAEQAQLRTNQAGLDEISVRCAHTDKLFNIRSAQSWDHRHSASMLIKKMYATRGYRTSALPDQPQPTRVTFVASDEDTAIGTMTIGFDSDQGLFVDDLFSETTNTLRAQGRRICEFTKLAMDSVVRSKQVLASLFHVAYIHAHRSMNFDDLLIEVNPRHVRYYQQMLGFAVVGEPQMNTRVGAMSVLMRLEFAHVHQKLKDFGGKPEMAGTERSLYPLSFTPADEDSILDRLIASFDAETSRHAAVAKPTPPRRALTH